MARVLSQAADPAEILREVVALDPGLRLVPYYGERAVFYNPGGEAPLGVILAAVKDRDGPNDRSANLARPGVYRFAFGMRRESFARRFGERPARPRKGGVIELPGYDPTQLDELMPHPVYGWMSWVQILAPTRGSFDSLHPLLAESLEDVRVKWQRRIGSDDSTAS
jgi:hypothetical protein